MISKQHTEFIRLVSKGINQSEAYRTTVGNPKATISQVKSKASKLSARYSVLIAQERLKAQKVIEEANHTKEAQIALSEILTQAEVDAINCRIIKGEEFEVKQLNNQGKVFKAMITPTIAERRAAIETYNKRFGSNEAIKINANVTDMPAPNIIMRKK